MEVEAQVAPEELEVSCVVRHDGGAYLAGRQGDEEVVPQGQDLGAQMGLLSPHFSEEVPCALPRGCAGRFSIWCGMSWSDDRGETGAVELLR